MQIRSLRVLAALTIGILFSLSASISSALTISVDMDSTTAGIQSNVIANLGDILNVSIVITGDGATAFDTAILDLAFNDAGSVLTLMSGPTVGSLAATAPVFALDVFGGIPFVLPGAPLTTDGAPAPPGFLDNLGGLGLASATLPFATIGLGATQSIADLTFQVTSLGSSTLGLAAFPAGSPALALAGLPIAHTFVAGSVTPIPEPNGAGLFAAGLAVVGFALRRSGQHRLDPRV